MENTSKLTVKEVAAHFQRLTVEDLKAIPGLTEAEQGLLLSLRIQRQVGCLSKEGGQRVWENRVELIG